MGILDTGVRHWRSHRCTADFGALMKKYLMTVAVIAALGSSAMAGEKTSQPPRDRGSYGYTFAMLAHVRAAEFWCKIDAPASYKASLLGTLLINFNGNRDDLMIVEKAAYESGDRLIQGMTEKTRKLQCGIIAGYMRDIVIIDKAITAVDEAGQ